MHVATTALVGIWRFIHPGELGADGIDVQAAGGHEIRIRAYRGIHQTDWL
jgi:hypothetical protein